MEGQLAGAMGAAAVGEAALGPEEAGAMDIVVRQPQDRGHKCRQSHYERRKRRRQLEHVW